ncbi:MAG: PRC-barrel domain-containing protein [Candidatus Heimdallarchaeota archaeon]
MAENKDNDSSASLNGGTDLEGKMIIDSTGEEVGLCKAVKIDDNGQIGLVFEVTINEITFMPKQTIPYSAISKITDVIELNTPLNIKIAQSADEFKETPTIDTSIEEKIVEVQKTKDEHTEVEPAEEEKEETTVKEEVKDPAEVLVNAELPVDSNKFAGVIEENTQQADPTEQLLKGLDEPEEVVIDKAQIIAAETKSKTETVADIGKDLTSSVVKLENLFSLLTNSEPEIKIEAIVALTKLTTISPILGLSLIPKLMELNDAPQQNVRLAIAQQLEVIGEVKPELFNGFYLEILENAFEEPIEEIREQLIKTLQMIIMKHVELDSNNVELFFEEVIMGKRVPEVPAKVLHDVTLKVVSSSFILSRIAIRVRLNFIAQGGKLAERCSEELEDYNATLIGLTIIESFTPTEASKLVKKPSFKEIGPIFIEVINQMIQAYEEGSIASLVEVVDKKIEIPISVIERFYEIKINTTLQGVKNVPMEVFFENALVSKEEAEQIIYRLVVQKKVNAAITMNNSRTFITSLDADEPVEKKPEKPKPQKESPKKKTPKTTAKKPPAKKPSTTKKTTAKPKTTTTKPKAKTTTTKKSATKSKTSTTKSTKTSK